MKPEWIDTDAALADAIERLRDAPRYALDTEFHRERTYWPHLALVQLAWADDDREHIALVDPLAVDVRPLRAVLEGPGVALLHACSQDLEILERECGTTPTRLFDPQIAAAFLGFKQASLGHLLEALLDVSLPKASQLADWTRRPLGDDARRYAANDVAHLLSLHDVLRERLANAGRLAWAEEECERARAKDRSPRQPERAWWRLKGKNKLKGRARRVAQTLAAWREREAARRDRPVRSVLNDLSLLALAHRPPKSPGDLKRTRGLDRRRLDDATTKGILEAARAGLDLPDDAVEIPPKASGPKANGAAVALCQAWLSEVASRENLDPAVLATRDDVSSLVRGAPSRLDEGWRHALVGAAVKALLAGERALAFEGQGLVLVPR